MNGLHKKDKRKATFAFGTLKIARKLFEPTSAVLSKLWFKDSHKEATEFVW